MPQLIVPNESVTNLLNLQISGTMGMPPTARLVGSEFFPDLTTTLSALNSIESTFAGYSAQNLGGWTTPYNVGNEWWSDATQVYFQNDETFAVDVYGVYLTDSGGTSLYGVSKFSAPISLGASAQLQLVCKWLLASYYTTTP